MIVTRQSAPSESYHEAHGSPDLESRSTTLVLGRGPLTARASDAPPTSGAAPRPTARRVKFPSTRCQISRYRCLLGGREPLLDAARVEPHEKERSSKI